MIRARYVDTCVRVNPRANRISNIYPIRYKGVTVPKDYRSDGLTKLVNKYKPRCIRAAFIHDFICDTKILPRKTGDQYFYEILILDGVGRIKARTMWLAVRAYAITTFKK